MNDVDSKEDWGNMNLNDLLISQGFDPKHVLVFRHRPQEPELNRVLPWLAAEKPNVFNAYQQTQHEKVERVMASMQGEGFIASFIGLEPGKALFIGLYSIVSATPMSFDEFWSVPELNELKTFGLKGWSPNTDRKKSLWFDLVQLDFYSSWKGKLSIGWPPPERSWWRRAHRNKMPILSIAEHSVLDSEMPVWDAIDFGWEELGVLPSRWKAALSQWRGIYYIYDQSDGKGYVGSAYGENNLWGRWLNYASKGDGGNVLLRNRDPHSFRFTILQRVSPDLDPTDVIRLESSWKNRLHSRKPFGLNAN